MQDKFIIREPIDIRWLKNVRNGTLDIVLRKRKDVVCVVIVSVLGAIGSILLTVLAWIIMLLLNAILWIIIVGIIWLILCVLLYHFMGESGDADVIMTFLMFAAFVALIVLATLCVEGTFRVIPLFW